jgi:hypothetical protein
MSRPLDQMTDVQGARRILVLWVPRKFSRWKRFGWGACMGRLWVQFTPGEKTGGVDVRSLPRLGSECQRALACLHIAVEEDAAFDVNRKVGAYLDELERWCGADRSAMRGGS